MGLMVRTARDPRTRTQIFLALSFDRPSPFLLEIFIGVRRRRRWQGPFVLFVYHIFRYGYGYGMEYLYS